MDELSRFKRLSIVQVSQVALFSAQVATCGVVDFGELFKLFCCCGLGGRELSNLNVAHMPTDWCLFVFNKGEYMRLVGALGH